MNKCNFWYQKIFKILFCLLMNIRYLWYQKICEILFCKNQMLVWPDISCYLQLPLPRVRPIFQTLSFSTPTHHPPIQFQEKINLPPFSEWQQEANNVFPFGRNTSQYYHKVITACNMVCITSLKTLTTETKPAIELSILDYFTIPEIWKCTHILCGQSC